MTRARKVDPATLKREYIYSEPPISYTDLAIKHGVARNTVAERGIKERWFEQREEFRASLGKAAVERLGDEWVRLEASARELAMGLGFKVLQKYEKQLDDPDFKVSTKDMVAVAAMVRALAMDAANARTNDEGEVVLHDPDATDLGHEDYRRALAAIDRLLGPGDPAPTASAGAEGAGEVGDGPDS